MLARYNICNCRGDKAESIVIIGGNTEDECADYAAETEALKAAGYADKGKCDGCGDSKFRAHFVEVVELEGRNRRIKISYDVVTPESAETGDFAEIGWEDEEGVCVDPDELDLEEHGSELYAVVALAVSVISDGVEASDYPTCCPGHTWYTEIDGETDYSDGSVKRFSYHLDGFSEAEELEIYARLIG
jgi:hypothetical protein